MHVAKSSMADGFIEIEMRRDLRTWLAVGLVVLAAAVGAADAQEAAKPSAPGAEAKPSAPDQRGPFAVTYRVRGDVRTFRGQDQVGHPLRQGEITYVGDVIRAGPDGEAVLKTDDAGMIGIRSNTEFLAERFQAQALDSDRMTLRILKGSLRVISGWIGRLRSENYEIRTPTATIGVRGTDHEPYVLPGERASGTPYQAGSYDKVNSGETYIQVGSEKTPVKAGQVGFARAASSNGLQTRGLFTLVLPVILDRVPDFYVGGSFENDLDEYAKTANATSTQRFKTQQTEPASPIGACNPAAIGKDWVSRFDTGVAQQDTAAILSLFADDAVIEVIVRDKSGQLSTFTLSRQEFASSTADAMRDLKNYTQRRLSLDAHAMPGANDAPCSRLFVQSEVIEQGRQNGKAYRAESKEEYTLELHDGQWRAVHAIVTQH